MANIYYLTYTRTTGTFEAAFDDFHEVVNFLHSDNDIKGIYLYTINEGYHIPIKIKGIID